MSTNILERPASPTIRLTAWLLAAMVMLIVVGSSIAKTEIVARGHGRIIPTARVQVVQPQTDGKIVSILVHEGQRVHAGDLLVQLDTTAARSDIKRVRASIEQQRLDANVARAIIKPLMTRDPADRDFVDVGRSTFEREGTAKAEGGSGAEAFIAAALASIHDQAAELDAQLDRLAASQKAQRARLEEARREQAIAGQYLASAKALYKQETISQYDYLKRVRDMDAAKSAAVVAEHSLDELVAEVAEARTQRAGNISKALADYRKQSNDAEIALEGLDGELGAAETRLANLSLTAPVDGRVEHLQVFTLGGFVQAGSTLMSIVPSGHKIEIEALFDNRDIGFLQTRQKAFIKFDAFPAERYGIVHARVAGIGANARQADQTGDWLYAVRLAPETSSIRVGGRQIEFAPGMTATVDVVTGERRLVSYFFAPIIKAIQDGFRER